MCLFQRDEWMPPDKSGLCTINAAPLLRSVFSCHTCISCFSLHSESSATAPLMEREHDTCNMPLQGGDYYSYFNNIAPKH